MIADEWALLLAPHIGKRLYIVRKKYEPFSGVLTLIDFPNYRMIMVEGDTGGPRNDIFSLDFIESFEVLEDK